MESTEDLFKGWHEFYILMGTAAGTLVGLTFVAASNGASIFKEKDRPALAIFLGPTVVHFTAVTLVSILALIPSHQWYTFALLYAAAGVIGLPYALRNLFVMWARNYDVDLLDRFFYTALPTVGYAMMLLATYLLYIRSGWGLTVAAAALVVLLLAGIRNAWDMTLWIVLKEPGDGPVHKKKKTQR